MAFISTGAKVGGGVIGSLFEALWPSATRAFDMDRPIRPVEFDDRTLAVLMDRHALCCRANPSSSKSSSDIVGVEFRAQSVEARR